MMVKFAIALFLVLFLLAPTVRAEAPLVPLTLLGSRPYEAGTYTQGLAIDGDRLYISSGLYGRSSVSKWRFNKTGPSEKQATFYLPKTMFAEGLALAHGEIYLLTWQEFMVFVLDPETLKVKKNFQVLGEGWGLAWDGENFWRSDGSNKLHPHRYGDFQPRGNPVAVYENGVAIQGINALVWDFETELLLANIYGEDRVAAINLTDGQVQMWLDASPLRILAANDGLDLTLNPFDTALNGLAVSPDGKSLWLTGKLWPRLYQVKWPPH
ncbi:MAG: glutaminyl-peptide cyclotransferase [Candidatus Adiutrix sp.]